MTLVLFGLTSAHAYSLKRFLQSLESLNVRYVQVEVEEASFEEKVTFGRLWLKAPDQFLWKGDHEDQQMILADGQSVWIYDPSLSQVSLYSQEDFIKNTPIILISSPKRFDENFVIDAIREDETGTWFDLSPRQENSYYDYIEVRMEDKAISQIVIRNRVSDVQTRIEFYYDKNSINAPISDSIFHFVPPEGADILGDTP